jgi:hypothetical protein
MTPLGERRYQPLEPPAVDAQIELVRGADGKVTGLVLYQNGRDLPGKRK